MRSRSRARAIARNRASGVVQAKRAAPPVDLPSAEPPSIAAQLRSAQRGHSLSRISVGGSAPVAQRMPAVDAGSQHSEQTQPANQTGLPDRLKAGVEALSGVSLDHVRVHYHSSRPAQVEALAYTQGTDIHVAPGQEQHLPHEAWHVVQQHQGRVRPTMSLNGASINNDASLEREADTMGQRAAGTPAQRPVGMDPAAAIPAIPAASGAPIQRYTEADGYRISDDLTTVVKQDSAAGGQELLTLPGRASAATAKLKAAGSVIRLREGGSVSFQNKDLGIDKKLVQVEPMNESTKTSGVGEEGMELWADCGKSARDVMGAGKGTGGGQPKAVYNAPDGKEAKTAGTANPHLMKREIMLQWLAELEKREGEELYDRTEYDDRKDEHKSALDKYGKAKAEGKDKKVLEDLLMKASRLDAGISEFIMGHYNDDMSEKEREDFDKTAGINKWVDPSVGEGYTISSGGQPKKDPSGKPIRTWNFHWAGVVMEAGGDNITLENYATGDASEKNTEWVYQMYGTAKAAEKDPNKKGQTFHEQHRDVFGQHGETPTTMRVKPN